MEEKSTRRRKVLQAISIRELEQVAVYGNVQITTQAVALLLEHEVDVVFFSMYGRFRGRLGEDGGYRGGRFYRAFQTEAFRFCPGQLPAAIRLDEVRPVAIHVADADARIHGPGLQQAHQGFEIGVDAGAEEPFVVDRHLPLRPVGVPGRQLGVDRGGR